MAQIMTQMINLPRGISSMSFGDVNATEKEPWVLELVHV